MLTRLIPVALILFAVNCSSTNHVTPPPEIPKLNDSLTVVFGDSVYNFADEMPEPIIPFADIAKKVEYPKDALQKEIQGTIVFRMIVDKLGNPKNIHVLKKLCDECDLAVVKAFEKAKFKPAKNNGKAVNVSIAIPVRLKIRNGIFDFF